MGLALSQEYKEEIIRNTNHSLEEDRILCNHCKRTKNNNRSCIGKCVADNEY